MGGGSVAPFLYQTRTICGIATLQSLSTKVLSSNTALPCRRRLHSTTQAANYASQHSKHRDLAAERSSFTIRRIESDQGESHEPSSSTAFRKSSGKSHPADHSRDQYGRVYDQRGAPSNEGKHFYFRHVDLSGGPGLEEDIDFGSNYDAFVEDKSFETDDIDAPEIEHVKPRRSRESTITISEKLAFDRIFEDIMARQTAQAPLENFDSAELGHPPGRKTRNKQHETLGSIMEGAVQATKRQEDLSFEGHSYSQAQEKMREAVDRYPAALRASAAKAIGLIGSRAVLHEDSRNTTDDFESLRQPERERVEGLLRAASTDVDLWQVLEQEVFPMVAKLGIGEKPGLNSKSTKKRKGRKSKGSTEVEHQSAEESELDLAVYGPLYPSHLLLSLRLLDREFAKPSPLVLNILPRIKSLGLISHVLGASTALYNELLRIYWYRYDDLNGVARLLTEMDQAGLDFDAETLDILRDINRMQIKIKNENPNSAIRQLWSLPEFKTGRLREWQAKIEASIEERGIDMAESLT